MKNLQEIKNTYAIEQGYEDWVDLAIHHDLKADRLDQHWTEICIRAQKLALEKAAEYFDMYWNKSAITNPENLIR